MNDQPFAIHITWTTYGTWLPGDKRGYVSPTRLPSGGSLPKKNIYGTEYTRNDSYTKQIAYAQQKYDTVLLTLEQAKVVAAQLIASCEE